jgi:tRNA-splicing ligase RtcB (3'-phosphate/5'-hydroxy nucleic acid ligase)
MSKNILRVLEALSNQGLHVTRNGPVWSIRSKHGDSVADVLLPDGFPLEGKALHQLAQLANAHHPAGGRVAKCCASPDFHPGDSGVAIGSIAQMEGMVLPGAVGTDINCGMRLHMMDMDESTFIAKKDSFVEKLKGDLLLGTRDLPMTGRSFRALFQDGLLGLLDDFRTHDDRRGFLGDIDLERMERDLDRVFASGTLFGNPSDAPDALLVDGHVRDGGLGTIGGGNHFVEVQVVDEVVDRSLAYAWGVKRGSMAFMIHSGSRLVGKHVGNTWKEKARKAWPPGVQHPEAGMFGLSTKSDPELVESYLTAEATASHYGFLNRMLLAEMVRRRMVEVYGQREAALVYDVPHNITLREGTGYVVRKGACPAPEGQPVIIPGSMGASSFLLVGGGSDLLVQSASHGAGRARARIHMNHVEDLGLDGVTCITLREERKVEEAPAAYKDIEPVIQAQVEVGLVRVVARMRPILTFKG